MCKFASESAPGWNVLAGVLSSFVARAPEAVAGRWQQLFQQDHLDVGWKIRTTLHGRKSFTSVRTSTDKLTSPSDRYRTPSPGKIDVEHRMEGGPLEGPQRLLKEVDGIVLPDAVSVCGSDVGDDGVFSDWGNN